MARHELKIENWTPAKLNSLLGHWSGRHKAKRGDAVLVGAFSLVQCIPKATGRRRVSLAITLGPGERGGDVDCYWKSVLDALTAARLLRNDSRQHCELGTVSFQRGPIKGTVIVLEDLPAAEPEPAPEPTGARRGRPRN